MARRKPERYGIIYDYVNQYYAEHSRYPSVRDIAAGTGQYQHLTDRDGQPYTFYESAWLCRLW